MKSQSFQLHTSHESEEWYTPAEYIEAARRVMVGGIDLDPASNLEAQNWIKAKLFYTVKDNALTKPWLGRVWLNPPYCRVHETGGHSNQDIWSTKLEAEYLAGNTTEAVLLVKAALGYKWFNYLFQRYPCVLTYDRITFVQPGGDTSKGKAKVGSAFFYFGPNRDRFKMIFGEFGRFTESDEVMVSQGVLL